MMKAVVLVLLYCVALVALGSWAYRDGTPLHLGWAVLLVLPAWYTWRNRRDERTWRAGILVPAAIPPVVVLTLTGLAGRWQF